MRYRVGMKTYDLRAVSIVLLGKHEHMAYDSIACWKKSNIGICSVGYLPCRFMVDMDLLRIQVPSTSSYNMDEICKCLVPFYWARYSYKLYINRST